MAHPFTIAVMAQPAVFHALAIDDDPRLLEQSYRLRYQVFCVERGFLNSAAYPDGLEIDEFDDHSVHLAVLDSEGTMVGTSRLIRPNPHGFPMFRHCAFFPELMPSHMLPVEVSRLAISRHYLRHRRLTEPLRELGNAMVAGARRLGANHLIAASEASLARRLVHLGFPYRVGGPVADYYGPVVACLMNLDEFDVGAGHVWTPALSQGDDETGLARR
jgi:N-acyl-L-homoserine lactone synthetase